MEKPNRPLVPAPPMPGPVAPAVIDDDFVKSRILTVRGVQVMLDRDLAMLYGVDAKRINEQVKRNAERFPNDFMFRLTKEECLRSQIATLNMERGKHLKYMPYAFTESGVASPTSRTSWRISDSRGMRATAPPSRASRRSSLRSANGWHPALGIQHCPRRAGHSAFSTQHSALPAQRAGHPPAVVVPAVVPADGSTTDARPRHAQIRACTAEPALRSFGRR